MPRISVCISVFCVLISISLGLFPPMAFTSTSANIPLPAPDTSGGKPLMETLSLRRSSRSFRDKDIPLPVVSSLLWAAQGINRPKAGLLTSPTAMNWQEIDVYIAKKEGLFLYDREEHALKHIKNEDIRAFLGVQEFTKKAPLGLIYVADMTKVSLAEPQSSFYAAADTGFLSQNVYLFCASEGLATVVIGWIDKTALSNKMGLKETQKIILAQPVGYPE